MSALERFFYGPFGAARAFLLLRVFMLMLALDASMLMIGHAGRYGVGGFNVAHFAWLDALLPLPTPGLYVGVLLATSLLALFIALSGVQRFTVPALTALYTGSWAMSMLDSYQHHYFMSLVLVCLCFFPEPSASALHGEVPANEIAAATKPKKRAKHHKRATAQSGRERAGWLYAASTGGGLAAYLALRPESGGSGALAATVALLCGATWLFDPSRGRPRLQCSGFGFPLLCATVAVLYVYAAVAKMDAAWVDGFTLRRISKAESEFSALVEWLVALGVPAETFWAWFSSSVIPLELSVAGAYLLAAVRDRATSPWPNRLCVLGFLLAMSLHLGAEAMSLQIGWFSYYMLAFGCVCLLPLRAVDALAVLASWPARYAGRFVAEWRADSAGSSAASTLAMAVGTAAVLGVVGFQIDLPGAISACSLAGALCVGASVHAAQRGAHLDARPQLLAAMLGAGVLWLSIALSPVRWDYYRYLGGDLMRRGEARAALDVYLKGERYAPPGESRQDKIDLLKRQLGR